MLYREGQIGQQIGQIGRRRVVSVELIPSAFPAVQHAGLYLISHLIPLNSAAATTWRIDAPAARVSVEYGRAGFTVKNNACIARLFEPCAPRYRVKFNIVARVYSGAGPTTVAGEFCAHALNCHLWPLYQKM
jgi:hypothetical protein